MPKPPAGIVVRRAMEALIPEALLAWGQAHRGLLLALGIGSAVMFAGRRRESSRDVRWKR